MNRQVLIAIIAAAFAFAVVPVVSAAGNSITVNKPAAGGVSFTVTAGGGVKGFVQVGVDCGAPYATRLVVQLDDAGQGTSQTIFPPAGLSCTATLEQGKQIGKFHVLATTAFTS
jgi:hypothetical protein